MSKPPLAAFDPLLAPAGYIAVHDTPGRIGCLDCVSRATESLCDLGLCLSISRPDRTPVHFIAHVAPFCDVTASATRKES